MGLKVRWDKRAAAGPDGAEEPLVATAYEGEEKMGRERGSRVGFIPWDSMLLETVARGIAEGYRTPLPPLSPSPAPPPSPWIVHVRRAAGVRAANSCTCGSGPSCTYLTPVWTVRYPAGLAMNSIYTSYRISRFYSGNRAYV